MSRFNVETIEVEEVVIYGLSKRSNDKTISKDTNELSTKFYAIINKKPVLPYFVLSKNYNENTKSFEMFVGSIYENIMFEKFKIPEGKYAKITINPKLGFMWGLSIGEAKRFFYKNWLKNSKYKPLNMEYEYHTEKSIGKYPTIDICFSITDNTE
jgi:predicted transcriptional regulator YdeE